jgi:DNA-binding NarL/FixJ family response regulator
MTKAVLHSGLSKQAGRSLETGAADATVACDRSPRIMLVEDEVIVAWDIAETLKRLGYTIVGMAENADQALRLAESVAPDLILMDIRLNGARDGIEAARMIRERTGHRVIYLTAHADLATMERAASTEPLGYVFKPFSQDGLRTALDRAIGVRRMTAGD